MFVPKTEPRLLPLEWTERDLLNAWGVRKLMCHNIILADSWPIFRAGAARILAIEDNIHVVGQCETFPKMLKAVESFHGALVVFAVSLLPEPAAITQPLRDSRTFGIAIIENTDDAQDYLKHGVQGIVYRNIAGPELVTAIGRVAQGGMYVQKRSDESAICSKTDFVGERVLDRLTLKELQIVACILRGYKNREIALELGTTEQVVKNYLRSVFDKTGVSDRLELALFTVHHSSLARAAAGALTRSGGEHLKIASRSPGSASRSAA